MVLECVEVLQVDYEWCDWIVGYDVGFEVGIILVWQLIDLFVDCQQGMVDVVCYVWVGQCQLLVLGVVGILQ